MMYKIVKFEKHKWHNIMKSFNNNNNNNNNRLYNL